MSDELARTTPDKQRDLEFFYRMVIYVLLLAGIYYAFKPYLGVSDVEVTPQQISEYSAQVKPVVAREIVSAITQSTKPTVLMVYASWCSYCRMVIPSMRGLWQEGKFSDKQLLFVSLDHGAFALAEYALKKDIVAMIGAPHILKASNPNLGQLLRPLGANFTGGIPYIAFFKAGGELAHEQLGFVSKSAIKDSLTLLGIP